MPEAGKPGTCRNGLASPHHQLAEFLCDHLFQSIHKTEANLQVEQTAFPYHECTRYSNDILQQQLRQLQKALSTCRDKEVNVIFM